MRFIALLVCMVVAHIAQVNGQGRSSRPPNSSGWANSNGVQAALRNIGIGSPSGQSPSSFDVDSFLSTVNNKTGGTPRGRPTNGNRRTTTVAPTPSRRRTTTVAPTPSRRRTTTVAPTPSRRRTTTVAPTPSRRQTTTVAPTPSRRQTTTIQQTTPTEAPATAQPLTRAILNSMKQEFELLFVADVQKIAKYVRMGFHMCVGGCNGCLDLKDSSNNGLASHYAELRRMHGEWVDVISLADYAALSTFMAVKAGVERNTNGCNSRQCSFSFTFTTGRKTCANIESPPSHDMPKGTDVHSPAGIAKDFGLTNDEMVALMGCHSLGRTHLSISGFQGPWDLKPTVLDNGYFLALSRTTWTQKFMPQANATQWTGVAGDTELMMLHADMILQRDITVSGPRKNATCAEARDCPHSSTSSIVDRYAVDNENFVEQLISAVTKMCNTAVFDPSLRQVFS